MTCERDSKFYLFRCHDRLLLIRSSSLPCSFVRRRLRVCSCLLHVIDKHLTFLLALLSTNFNSYVSITFNFIRLHLAAQMLIEISGMRCVVFPLSLSFLLRKLQVLVTEIITMLTDLNFTRLVAMLVNHSLIIAQPGNITTTSDRSLNLLKIWVRIWCQCAMSNRTKKFTRKCLS